MTTQLVMTILNKRADLDSPTTHPNTPFKLYTYLVPTESNSSDPSVLSDPSRSKHYRSASPSHSQTASHVADSRPASLALLSPIEDSIMYNPHSSRMSKPPTPSLIVEPSVPAACASLLSLRTGGRAATSHTAGSLPMLTTALSLLEGTSRAPRRAQSAHPRRSHTSTASAHSRTSHSSQSSQSARPSSSADDLSRMSRSKKPSASRFWDTVLPAAPRSQKPHHIAPVAASSAPMTSRPTVPHTGSVREKPSTPATRPMSHRSPLTSSSRESGSAPTPTAGSAEDESNKMNIPCVVCGVRFRKPGHLNMHWRSVHAASADAVYPGRMHARPAAALSPSSSTPRTPCEASNAARISKAKGARPYGCPQCVKRFRRGSDRNRHMRMVHAKIRPFECTQCGSHFGRKSFLEAHISTVHEKQRPFRCDCGAAFGQRSSLTRHSKKIHGPS